MFTEKKTAKKFKLMHYNYHAAITPASDSDT